MTWKLRYLGRNRRGRFAVTFGLLVVIGLFIGLAEALLEPVCISSQGEKEEISFTDDPYRIPNSCEGYAQYIAVPSWWHSKSIYRPLPKSFNRYLSLSTFGSYGLDEGGLVYCGRLLSKSGGKWWVCIYADFRGAMNAVALKDCRFFILPFSSVRSSPSAYGLYRTTVYVGKADKYQTKCIIPVEWNGFGVSATATINDDGKVSFYFSQTATRVTPEIAGEVPW